ncbi:MAG: hydrogenase maturation protease [Archaeoglobaceae archaeon]|nr:hydrogenase maturation protease [Archaeoglobaceae archaeon]MDW8127858.1 hydrogenase maturation protease [Archaeoglobaceae archaeon]
MPLILFLGNPIYSDDRIGLIVGEKLKNRFEEEGFEVEILEKSGYNLVDYIAGQEIVFVVDSIVGEVGEVVLIENLEDLKILFPRSPHYSGLPESLELMKALNLAPKNFFVIGICVKDPFTISDKMSPELEEIVDFVAERVYNCIKLLHLQPRNKAKI